MAIFSSEQQKTLTNQSIVSLMGEWGTEGLSLAQTQHIGVFRARTSPSVLSLRPWRRLRNTKRLRICRLQRGLVTCPNLLWPLCPLSHLTGLSFIHNMGLILQILRIRATRMFTDYPSQQSLLPMPWNGIFSSSCHTSLSQSKPGHFPMKAASPEVCGNTLLKHYSKCWV